MEPAKAPDFVVSAATGMQEGGVALTTLADGNVFASWSVTYPEDPDAPYGNPNPNDLFGRVLNDNGVPLTGGLRDQRRSAQPSGQPDSHAVA